MSTMRKTERISTAASIATLGISEGQRNRALADLAMANTMVGAFISAAKFLNLR